MRISLAVIAVAFGVGYLVIAASEAEGVTYKEASAIRLEAQAKPPVSPPSKVKLTGKVVDGSIALNASGLGARFSVVDSADGLMDVEFGGAIPDAFRDGSEVVVTGIYDRSQDTFEAHELLTKCPSKYEGAYDSGSVRLGSHPKDVPMEEK